MNILVVIIIVLSFGIAIFLAILNSYVVNLKGAEVDAERLLSRAEEWVDSGSVEWVVDSDFFVQFLGLLKLSFSLDEFGLTVIGVILYYVAYIFIFTRYKGVYFSWASLLLVVLCLLSPSVLLRVSALLREPYCIFFGVLAVWFGVQFIVERKILKLILSLACIVMAGFFHKAFLAFIPLFVSLLAFFSVRRLFYFGLLALVLGILLVASVSYLIPVLGALRGGDALVTIISGDLSIAEKIVGYKSGLNARTTYDYGADFSTFLSVLGTFMKASAYYYLAPFPWGVSNTLDIMVLVENISRFICLVYLVFKAIASGRRDVYFVLLCYFLLNLIWALGTSNYGTGSRHHMTAIPFLMMGYIMIFNRKSLLGCQDNK